MRGASSLGIEVKVGHQVVDDSVVVETPLTFDSLTEALLVEGGEEFGDQLLFITLLASVDLAKEEDVLVGRQACPHLGVNGGHCSSGLGSNGSSSGSPSTSKGTALGGTASWAFLDFGIFPQLLLPFKG